MKKEIVIKRGFDLIFSVCFLSVFWWIYLIAWIGIKFSSQGPVIYRASRVGMNGQLFSCLKFRSMRVDSGKVRLTTLANDERVFPFGKFIRITKIDEMPQIFNILRGEMSVVGPRPEDEPNAERLYIGEYKEILNVKPGLTSLASLYDYTHGELYEDMDEYEREIVPRKLALELAYVRQASLCMDMRIILRTGLTVIAKSLGKTKFKPPKELELLTAQRRNEN